MFFLTGIFVITLLTPIRCRHTSLTGCKHHTMKIVGAVCASNGKSYPTVCDYQDYKILSEPNLTILHKGPCKENSHISRILQYPLEGLNKYQHASLEGQWHSMELQETLGAILEYNKAKNKRKQKKKKSTSVAPDNSGKIYAFPTVSDEYYDLEEKDQDY